MAVPAARGVVALADSRPNWAKASLAPIQSITRSLAPNWGLAASRRSTWVVSGVVVMPLAGAYPMPCTELTREPPSA